MTENQGLRRLSQPLSEGGIGEIGPQDAVRNGPPFDPGSGQASFAIDAVPVVIASYGLASVAAAGDPNRDDQSMAEGR
jgi:hypothetical protein